MMLLILILILILLSISSSKVTNDNILLTNGGYKKNKKNERVTQRDFDNSDSDVNEDIISKKKKEVDDDDSKNDNDEDDNDEDDDDDDNDEDDDDYDYDHRKPLKKKNASILDSGLKSISTLADFAAKVTKKSLKLSVDFLASAHVIQSKILGKWRLHQDVEVRKGVILSCPATIEFLDDSTLLTFFNDEEYKSEYSFKEKNWPQKCSISFNAKTFQGPKDAEPVNLYYHGYFKRSLLNPNIIFIRGKVYSLKGKSFWKKQQKIGKFKLTKSRY